jgi:DNA (cytosine-5)-methyltransferase 1
MTRPFTYGSVCSGIEAASVAWEPLGWKPAFFSEIDANACFVLHHRLGAGRPVNMPDPELAESLSEQRLRRSAVKAIKRIPTQGTVTNYGDFTKIPSDAGPIDLLVGGTPCQDFSVAGQRAGLDGERGNLTLEFSRLAEKLCADWFVWENVPGVFSLNQGRDFGAVLACFAGYGDGHVFEPRATGWGNAGVVEPAQGGYGLAWRVLDAQYVRVAGFPYAVPQRRRRVFIVGYLGDWRPAAAVLFERNGLRGDPAPRRQQRQGASRGFEAGLGECRPADVSPTLECRAHNGPRRNQVTAGVIEAIGGYQDGTTRGPVLTKWSKGSGGPAGDEMSNMVAMPVFDCKGSEVATLTDGASPTLRAMGRSNGHDNGGGQLAVAYDLRGREGGAQFEGPHDTANMRAGDGGSSRSYVNQPIAFAQNSRDDVRMFGGDGATVGALAAEAAEAGTKQQSYVALPNWAVRRLTPRECERLQGFPDDWTLVSNAKGKPMADGPRYKQCGNSMPTNVIRWIGTRIEIVRELIAKPQV